MNRPKQAAAAVAAIAGLFVVGIVTFLLLLSPPECDTDTGTLSELAKNEIPADVIPMYAAAAKRWNIDIAFLAAIGQQEGQHGTNPATRVVNWAGCIGFMQLGVGGLCGDFWGSNKCDGNNDGKMSVLDDWDNICAAAHGLRKDKGAPPAGGSEEGYYRAACGYYGACSDAAANYAPEVMATAKLYGFKGGTKTDTGDLEEFAAGPGASSTTGTTEPAATSSVLSFGDSLAVGTTDPLKTDLDGRRLRTDAKTGLTATRGAQILKSDPPAEKTWVISLGTNDTDIPSFRAAVKSIKKLAGDKSAELFWVNIARKTLGGTTDVQLNTVLTEELDAAQIIDWKGAVDDGKAALGDKVHPGPDGYKTRAKMIADAIGAPRTPAVPTDQQCAGGSGGGPLGKGNPDAKALTKNKNITFANASQVQDLNNGRIHPRLVALLDSIASKYKITITALASDHNPGSNHEPGRAADIAIVGDDNCMPPDQAGDCWKLAQQLDKLEGCMVMTELIYYFDPGPSAGSFAAADHDDHIHAGWDGPLGPKQYTSSDPCLPA